MLNYQRVLHPFPTVPHGSLPCLFSSADGGDGSAEADGIPTGLRDGGWGRFHCRSAPICKGGCQRQRYMMIRYDKSWYIHIYSKISGYMNYIWYTMYIRTYIYIYIHVRENYGSSFFSMYFGRFDLFQAFEVWISSLQDSWCLQSCGTVPFVAPEVLKGERRNLKVPKSWMVQNGNPWEILLKWFKVDDFFRVSPF